MRKKLSQIFEEECYNRFYNYIYIFSMMSLKRQNSKKGNFVFSNAGLLERDFGYS